MKQRMVLLFACVLLFGGVAYAAGNNPTSATSNYPAALDSSAGSYGALGTIANTDTGEVLWANRVQNMILALETKLGLTNGTTNLDNALDLDAADATLYAANIVNTGNGGGVLINNAGTGNLLALQDGGVAVVTIANGGNIIATKSLDLDDGATDSPSLIFTDQTNETVTMTKTDSSFLGITTAAADGVNILVGNLKVGNGSPSPALDGEDGYVEGTFEVGGNAKFNAEVNIDGTVDADVSAFNLNSTGTTVAAITLITSVTGGIDIDSGAAGIDIDLDAGGPLAIDGDLVVIGNAGVDGGTADGDNDLLVVGVVEVDGVLDLDGSIDADVTAIDLNSSGTSATACNITTTGSGGGTTITTGSGGINLVGRATTTDGVTSGTAKVIGGLAYSQVAASTAITNATTIEQFFDKTYSVPANTLKAGTVAHIKLAGIVTGEASTDTLTIKLYIGSTALVTTAAVDSATSDIWYADVDLLVRTAGGSGTFVAIANYQDADAGTLATKRALTGSTAIDTTAANIIRASATWSASTATCTCRQDILTVEII